MRARVVCFLSARDYREGECVIGEELSRVYVLMFLSCRRARRSGCGGKCVT